MASSFVSPPASKPHSFTTMDKYLDSIGSHCQYTYRNQFDFLPFRCESCKGRYCVDQRTENSHEFPLLETDDDLVGILWRCAAIYAAALVYWRTLKSFGISWRKKNPSHIVLFPTKSTYKSEQAIGTVRNGLFSNKHCISVLYSFTITQLRKIVILEYKQLTCKHTTRLHKRQVTCSRHEFDQ